MLASCFAVDDTRDIFWPLFHQHAYLVFPHLVSGVFGEGARLFHFAGGFMAAVPAVCGLAGGILGGVISDGMLRRGNSLTRARKNSHRDRPAAFGFDDRL